MEILHNEPISIDGHCGKVILCFFSEDKEAANPLLEELMASEFRVDVDILDDSEALTHMAAVAGNRLLDTARAMVLFLGDSLLSGKNQPKRNLLFHRVGYFSAMYPDKLILCSHAEVGTAILEKTPLQDMSVAIHGKNPETGESCVLEILRKKTTGRNFSKMKKDSFYPSDTEDAAKWEESVGKRITYRRIGVRLDITRADFEAAKELYGRDRSAVGVEAASFLHDLKEKLSAGARLFSFGHEQNMRPQLIPYDAERAITPCDYPKNFKNRVKLRTISDPPEGADAVIAFLEIEYILPVHSYLGLCCKPYIKGNRDLDGEVLERLFASALPERHDVHAEKARLYFRFDFKDAMPPAPLGERVGSFADIVYPE